jgi:hypothetical protein
MRHLRTGARCTAMARLAGIALVLLLVLGDSSDAQPKAKPLRDQDIAAMVKAGLAESVILLSIEANPCDFDISAAQLIVLKNQNVSDSIIHAMLAAESKKRGTSRIDTGSPGAGTIEKAATRFPIFPVDFFAEAFTSSGQGAARVPQGSVFVGSGRLRFESTDAKTTIVDPLTFTGYVLMAGKPAKVVPRFEGVLGIMNQNGLSRYLLPVNPQSPCEYWMGVVCKNLGSDMLQGRAATKWELTHYSEDESWATYAWVDVRLHIVSKRQYEQNTVELRNITEGPQPIGLFQLP